MVNNTGIQSTPPYATSSALGNYSWEELQEYAAENMHRGYEPYETYPAKWHNSVLHQLTVTLEQIKVYCDSVQAELKNILIAAGKTPDPSQTDQLAQSIQKLSELPIATASALGAVKSTASDWGVAVDGTTGVMSVNTTGATTKQKGIVQLNDTLTSSSTTEALTAKQGKALNDTILAMDCSAPTASGTALSFIDSVSQTDGKISATKKTVQSAARGTSGVIALPSGKTTNRYLREDGDWATPPAYVYLKLASGKLYAQVTDSATPPTGYTLGTTGIELPTAPTHVTSAQYLRPSAGGVTCASANADGYLKVPTGVDMGS